MQKDRLPLRTQLGSSAVTFHHRHHTGIPFSQNRRGNTRNENSIQNAGNVIRGKKTKKIMIFA